MIPHCGISNCGVVMEFLYSITVYKCGVYNIPEKLQMITTFSTYYGTDLVFPVVTDGEVTPKSLRLQAVSEFLLKMFTRFRNFLSF